jgi:hypothetical protein
MLHELIFLRFLAHKARATELQGSRFDSAFSSCQIHSIIFCVPSFICRSSLNLNFAPPPLQQQQQRHENYFCTEINCDMNRRLMASDAVRNISRSLFPPSLSLSHT